MAITYPNNLLTSTALTKLVNERPELEQIRQRYLWRTFFPPMESPERKLTWESVRAENNLAGFYHQRDQVVPMPNDSAKQYFADLINIKAAKIVDAETVQLIRDPGMVAVYKAGEQSSHVQGIAQRVKREIAKAVNDVDNSIEATMEYLAVNTLRGTVNWPPQDSNGNSIINVPHWNPQNRLTVTMPRNANYAQDATTLTGWNSKEGTRVAWNQAGADPLYDLEVIGELLMEQDGVDIENATIVLSHSTLLNLARATKIVNKLFGDDNSQNGTRSQYSFNALKDYVKAQWGFNFFEYGAKYTYQIESGNDRPQVVNQRFLPDGEVLIIPNNMLDGGTVGNMMLGLQETVEGNFMYGKYARVHRDEKTFVNEIIDSVTAWPIIWRGQEVFKLRAYN